MQITEEQQMLKDMARRFVADHYPSAKRMARLAAGQHFDSTLWQSFAELGLTGVGVPEDDGGMAGGAVEHALLMEEFGRGLVLEPYVASVVAAGAVLSAAPRSPIRDEVLSAMVQGSAVPVLAYIESTARFDPLHCRLRATRDGQDWVLSGDKSLVLGGGAATHFIVSARTSADSRRALTLFVVPRKHPDLECVDVPTLDGRAACRLGLRDLRLGDEHRLGGIDGGAAGLSRAVDRALSASLAEAVGIMDVMLAQTIEYLKTRKQFGKPLSINQALQHRLVDMHIAIEESRVMSAQAARSLDRGSELEARRTLSAAKLLIGQAMRRVGQEAVQLHGAIGTTHEADIAHYFKRLTLLRTEYGDVDWHAMQSASMLRNELSSIAAAGEQR